ncbi:peroxidase 5-like [Quercus suber]|uniref:peroxidase 5-like n=1 Tax=Quercus suber TaxID=58331 RepID=UPI0032E03D8C
MDPIFARDLKTKCPQNGGNDDPTVPLDVLTPHRLDNKYYTNLKKHHGLLTSDQSLLSSPSTVGIVRNNARHGETWANKFAAAMVKMGYIDLLTGSQEFGSMDPIFARDLKTKCPQNGGNDDPTVPLDVLTPHRLDNKYYTNLKKHHGLLTSDQSLLSSPSTVGIVRNNARHGETWANKFAAAMVKMGYIDLLTGSQEINGINLYSLDVTKCAWDSCVGFEYYKYTESMGWDLGELNESMSFRRNLESRPNTVQSV